MMDRSDGRRAVRYTTHDRGGRHGPALSETGLCSARRQSMHRTISAGGLVSAANVTLLGAFAAGILSFLSPCVLPLTPIYVARLVGPAVWEGQTLGRDARARLRTVTLLHAAAF